MREMTMKLERCDLLGEKIPGRVPENETKRIINGFAELIAMRGDSAIYHDNGDGNFYALRRIPSEGWTA